MRAAAPQEDLSHLSLEELLDVKVTTATRIEESASTAPATVYVITADDIQHLGLRGLKDILALVPGVDTIDPHFFLLGGQRGFAGSFANTLLLVNGREMNNLIAGETFISNQFRAGNIAQVEVINGPGSAIYGANALGGVINIITKTAAPFDGVEGLVSGGSFDTREATGVFGGHSGELSVRGAASFYRSHGDDFSEFLSDTAKASPAAENNAYRRLPDVYGYINPADAWWISTEASWRGLYAGTEMYRNVTGRGTSGIQWDYTRGSDHRDLRLGYGGYRFASADKRLLGSAELRTYREIFWGNHTEDEGPIVNPQTGATITRGATDSDIETYRGFYSNHNGGGSRRSSGIVQSTFALSPMTTLAGGVTYERSNIVTAAFSRTEGSDPVIGPENRQPEYRSWKWGAYAESQLKLREGRVIATLGARYDEHEWYGGSFNPRLGIVFKAPGESTFKVLYGEAFREPTVFEISNSNGSIRPSTERTFEVGWSRYFGGAINNQIVFFHNDVDDVIVTDAVAIGGISNKGELRSHGIEDQLRFTHGRFSGFVNYTWLKSGQNFDLPQQKANVVARYEAGAMSVALIGRYHGATKTEYHDATYGVPSYAVFDAAVTKKLANVSLQLSVKNLFDRTYYQPEPRAPSVVMHPQDGRDVQLTLRFSMR